MSEPAHGRPTTTRASQDSPRRPALRRGGDAVTQTRPLRTVALLLSAAGPKLGRGLPLAQDETPRQALAAVQRARAMGQ